MCLLMLVMLVEAPGGHGGSSAIGKCLVIITGVTGVSKGHIPADTMIKIVKCQLYYTELNHGFQPNFANKHLVVVVHKRGAVVGDSLWLVKWVPFEVQQAVAMYTL